MSNDNSVAPTPENAPQVIQVPPRRARRAAPSVPSVPYTRKQMRERAAALAAQSDSAPEAGSSRLGAQDETAGLRDSSAGEGSAVPRRRHAAPATSASAETVPRIAVPNGPTRRSRRAGLASTDTGALPVQDPASGGGIAAGAANGAPTADSPRVAHGPAVRPRTRRELREARINEQAATGAIPTVTGSAPTTTDAIPAAAGPTPAVTGSTSAVTESVPAATGAIPATTGAVPRVSSEALGRPLTRKELRERAEAERRAQAEPDAEADRVAEAERRATAQRRAEAERQAASEAQAVAPHHSAQPLDRDLSASGELSQIPAEGRGSSRLPTSVTGSSRNPAAAASSRLPADAAAAASAQPSSESIGTEEPQPRTRRERRAAEQRAITGAIPQVPEPRIEPPARTGAIRALDVTGELAPIRDVPRSHDEPPLPIAGRTTRPVGRAPATTPAQDRHAKLARPATTSHAAEVAAQWARLAAETGVNAPPQPAARAAESRAESGELTRPRSDSRQPQGTDQDAWAEPQARAQDWAESATSQQEWAAPQSDQQEWAAPQSHRADGGQSARSLASQVAWPHSLPERDDVEYRDPGTGRGDAQQAASSSSGATPWQEPNAWSASTPAVSEEPASSLPIPVVDESLPASHPTPALGEPRPVSRPIPQVGEPRPVSRPIPQVGEPRPVSRPIPQVPESADSIADPRLDRFAAADTLATGSIPVVRVAPVSQPTPVVSHAEEAAHADEDDEYTEDERKGLNRLHWALIIACTVVLALLLWKGEFDDASAPRVIPVSDISDTQQGSGTGT